MSHYQPTLTQATFEPAARLAPALLAPALLAPGPDADTRLPPAVAIRIIAASSLGLWVVLWKIAASLLGS